MTKTIFLIIFTLFLSACTYPGVINQNQNINQPSDDQSVINDFKSCVAAGNPVMESYPRQCRANGQTFTENVGNYLENDCLANNGNWLAEYQECENTDLDWCEDNNGNFDECASACRHDPDAEICTMQCVPVCSF